MLEDEWLSEEKDDTVDEGEARAVGVPQNLANELVSSPSLIAHSRKACAHSPTLAGVEVALRLPLEDEDDVGVAVGGSVGGIFIARVMLVVVGEKLTLPLIEASGEGKAD